jgi:putative ABC transport system permease protein
LSRRTCRRNERRKSIRWSRYVTNSFPEKEIEMSAWSKINSWFRNTTQRSASENEMDAELRHHIEARAEDFVREGASREQALRRARLEFGAVDKTKEECREARGVSFIENAAQDLRYAFRTLRKNPGFTAVAVITLAAGIGANTAIFSVIDGVLLRPLGYPQPDRIVRIWQTDDKDRLGNLSDPNFTDLQQQNRSLQTMAEYAAYPVSMSGGSEPTRAIGAVVSKDFFSTMRTEPFIGRSFAQDERHVGAARTAIVNYGYWQRYLGASTDFSRMRLHIEGDDYSVIGVMPAGFNFPTDAAVWIPRELEAPRNSRTALNWHGLGRLRDGVTLAQAQADLQSIAATLKKQYVDDTWMTGAAVRTLQDSMVGPMRPALFAISGGAAFLLLVGCANIASLLLAQIAARKRELAVRVALGAGRSRLVSQFLVETLLLSLLGAAAGIPLALWGVAILPRLAPPTLALKENIGVNWTVLAFALGVAIVVAVVLGLVAAVRASGANPQTALAEGGRTGSPSASGQRTRRVLVVAQVAITLILLAGAGLLGRSFLQLLDVQGGFHPENVVAARFSPPPSATDADKPREVQFLDNALAKLRSVPGVTEVGLTGSVPPSGQTANGTFILMNGIAPPKSMDEFGNLAKDPARLGDAEYCVVSEGYFRALQIPLVRGRLFHDSDTIDAPHVAIISEALARAKWPDSDPIGQTIEFGNMDSDTRIMSIVGVVGDVRMDGPTAPQSPLIYTNYRQRPQGADTYNLLVRTEQPPAAIISTARGIFHDLDPTLPVEFSTVSDEVSKWYADRRFTLLLLGVFAATALLIAAVGIYGVIAYAVSQRTQEIGVRVALGAQRSHIMNLVLGQGFRLVIIGVVAGLAGAFVLTRFLSAMLFNVKSYDPLTFAAVALLLAAVAMLASSVPARRAMRVDPIVALRYE